MQQEQVFNGVRSILKILLNSINELVEWAQDDWLYESRKMWIG